MEYLTNNVFPHFIDRKADRSKLNPIYESFRRIDSLSLNYSEMNDIEEILQDIGDLELKIDGINLNAINSEELEILMNYQYYKKGVESIFCFVNSDQMLDNTFFQNIKKLNTRSLTLFIRSYFESIESYCIKVLKNVHNGEDLKLIKGSSGSKCNLSFVNVPIFINSNEDIPMVIKCKRFSGVLKLNQLNSKFWYSRTKSNEIHGETKKFLHLIDSEALKFTNYFKNLDKEETKQTNHIFAEYKSKSLHKGEIIIPMAYLNFVHINDSQAKEIIDKEDQSVLIDELGKAIKFQCLLVFSNELLNIDKYASLFPKQCSYYIYWHFLFTEELGPSFNSKYSTIIESFERIRISSFKVNGVLSKDQIDLVKEIVSSQNSKIYLREIYLNLNFLEDAVECLDMLSECQNFELASFTYKYIKTPECKTCEEIITKAKNKLFGKIGITSNIKIKHV